MLSIRTYTENVRLNHPLNIVNINPIKITRDHRNEKGSIIYISSNCTNYVLSLHFFFQETLRFIPSVPLIGRDITTECQLGKELNSMLNNKQNYHHSGNDKITGCLLILEKYNYFINCTTLTALQLRLFACDIDKIAQAKFKPGFH